MGFHSLCMFSTPNFALKRLATSEKSVYDNQTDGKIVSQCTDFKVVQQQNLKTERRMRDGMKVWNGQLAYASANCFSVCKFSLLRNPVSGQAIATQKLWKTRFPWEVRRSVPDCASGRA